jgi:hypothetical protein
MLVKSQKRHKQTSLNHVRVMLIVEDSTQRCSFALILNNCAICDYLSCLLMSISLLIILYVYKDK